MMPKPSNALVIGALVIAMAALGGCALSSAAAILPSAVGASPVVGQNLGSGQGDSFWVARYDDVVQAALRAGEKLSLELKEQEIEEDSAKLLYTDDLDKEISLHIERRTATVTRVRFDAESDDFLGFARLLGRQIIDELNEADAFVVDWSVKEGAPDK